MLFSERFQCLSISQTIWIRPFAPALSAIRLLQLHIQGIIIQPFLVFFAKCLKLRSAFDPASLKCLLQDLKTVQIDLLIIDIAAVISEITGTAFFLLKPALFNQRIQIDKIRIPCKR